MTRPIRSMDELPPLGCDQTHLMSVALECRRIVLAAEKALGPLPKKQYLDLVADNIPNVPLETLRAALVVAGVGY